MWYKNIAGRFFGLVTKHACGRRTDGRTDRQNYDSHSIAESRGKNHTDIGLLLKCNVSSYRPNIPSQVQCNSVVKLQRSELTLTSALKDYNISRPQNRFKSDRKTDDLLPRDDYASAVGLYALKICLPVCLSLSLSVCHQSSVNVLSKRNANNARWYLA